MNPYRYARHLVILALVAGALGVAQQVQAQGPEEVRAILADRADAHGVSAAYLTAIAQCESRLVPTAVGDSGHSHGLVQLSDLSTGLLSHYHAQGYGSAYDAWSAADYLARVVAGEFAREGVTVRRWSCA